MKPERAVRILVEGRVQGVGFRYATQRAGSGAGLTGWVRNRRDGAVEAFVQGPAASVEAMIDWCREGPSYARVDRLTISDAEPDETRTTFGIRP